MNGPSTPWRGCGCHFPAADARHCSEVALRDLLPQDDAAVADVATKGLGEVEQCPGHASLDR